MSDERATAERAPDVDLRGGARDADALLAWTRGALGDAPGAPPRLPTEAGARASYVQRAIGAIEARVGGRR